MTSAGSVDAVQTDGVGLAVRGASLLTGATLLANAGNYGINVLLGRQLEQSAFAAATLMVTLMLAATAASMSLQFVTAKTVSQQLGSEQLGSEHWVLLKGWQVGAVLALGLAGTARLLSSFFQTESALPFVALAAGMPFLLVTAVGRGMLQGRRNFVSMATSYAVEVVVRGMVTVALVLAGVGVLGATIGLSISFAMTWLAVSRAAKLPLLPSWARSSTIGFTDRTPFRRAMKPVALLAVAQVLVNNEDVLFAKRALLPSDAGRYGAVALIGRGIFYATWAVATAVFPVSASRTGPVGRADRLLLAAIGAIVLIGGGATIGAWLLGDAALGTVFGRGYRGLAGPLVAYAIVTTLFAVANLFATYQLSLGNSMPSLILLCGAALQTVLLVANHSSMRQILTAQMQAMVVVVLVVIARHISKPTRRVAIAQIGRVKQTGKRAELLPLRQAVGT